MLPTFLTTAAETTAIPAMICPCCGELIDLEILKNRAAQEFKTEEGIKNV